MVKSQDIPNTYRCYFVDYEGHIHDVAELTADGDTAALNQARVLLGATEFPGFELWLEARLVWEEYWPPNDSGSNEAGYEMVPSDRAEVAFELE